MEQNVIYSTKRERITSLDALRAFILLGILITHAINLFGLSFDGYRSILDGYIAAANHLFLMGKCNTVFAVLFGVSFYLILKNPNNSSEKFVWRCFLLMLMGLFNILFFTYDVLMLYGFWGMVLVLFRNLKAKYLIVLGVIILIVSTYLSGFRLGDKLFGPLADISLRYGKDKSFFDVVFYKLAVVDNLHIILNNGVLSTLAKFIFGYWIAKIGFIDYVQQRMTKRLLLTIWSVFIVCFLTKYLFHVNIKLFEVVINYSASAAYASALLYAYYHSGFCNRILKLFEPYGRLGLTNYSMGSTFGVIFINEFGLGLYKYPLAFVVLFFFGFFLLQAVFSYYWLRYFTYGPMEYVWRVATERKKIPFLRKT